MDINDREIDVTEADALNRNGSAPFVAKASMTPLI